MLSSVNVALKPLTPVIMWLTSTSELLVCKLSAKLLVGHISHVLQIIRSLSWGLFCVTGRTEIHDGYSPDFKGRGSDFS